jgi:hypothetical protein
MCRHLCPAVCGEILDDVSRRSAYLYNLHLPNNTRSAYAAVRLELTSHWSQEACVARVNLGDDLGTCSVRS